MLENVIIMLVSLAALMWSADKFVYGAAALARNLGLSPLIIGLTIVAMGSSAPEMMVAATASMADKPDTAIGNVIGSNITNITLVLGVTALLKPMLVGSVAVRRELPIILATSLVAVYFIYDLQFTRTEGILLAILFVLTIGYLAYASIHKTPEQAASPDLYEDELSDDVPEGVPVYMAVIWLIIGLAILLLSSDFLVDSAVFIAKEFGISDLVIGLTIIAIGTSLPELAASIAGVIKGEDDLALGNIVGSNIFNALAVLCIPGIIAPGAVDPSAVTRDSLVMIAVTVLLILMAIGISKGPRSINRIEGGILLACFIAYQYVLFGLANG
ncbi:CaCA family Na(+)/Ca(+) antiporter [Catenovulum agarivorans DS-2]|uniref:CaCA family Na(+)/Ca(+) antiporter n=1 Tax=Catenovulum agarivorans DS-2 TaxID=1328313 RepID=W7Q8K7_9ALTE|nr:calcium/sodium antiporter [Catenovulum agarivorans]EWH09134.1 CaCA family Na(+)/Ca(+) antiporter [Catenovulum agarivorans DS-2]